MVEITDTLNNDSGAAKKALSHLRKQIEKSMQSSDNDNPKLNHCITVIETTHTRTHNNFCAFLFCFFVRVLCTHMKKKNSQKKICKNKTFFLQRCWIVWLEMGTITYYQLFIVLSSIVCLKLQELPAKMKNINLYFQVFPFFFVFFLRICEMLTHTKKK